MPINPDPANWSGSPPCPFCSAKRTLPCENENEYPGEDNSWLPLAAGVSIVLISILLLLIAGSILRPLSVVFLLAGLAYLVRLRENRLRKHRKLTVPHLFYCEDCRRTFLAVKQGTKENKPSAD